MSDNFIVGVITSVEDADYQGKAFKKVTLGTGQVLNVKYGREGVLKAKWGLLVVGAAMKFTMQDYTKTDGVKIPFVFDIETVEGQLPPHIEPTNFVEPSPKPEPKKEIAPQEVGLAYKILAELYVTGFIDENKPDGKELVLRLKMWLKETLLGR